MFDTSWIDDLDREATLVAAAENVQVRLEADAAQMRLAAHWADLYSADAAEHAGRALGGMERTKRLGGDGTPEVLEFAASEFGAVQDMHPVAAENLIRDCLNLRHRHPLLQARIDDGGVPVWKAREVAKRVDAAGLSREQAMWVDEQTTPVISTLPWSRFSDVLDAKIIEADPAAEDARRKAAAAERFVRTGQCNEYGLKTIIAKCDAGDAIWFMAMVDRIALILFARGDGDPVDVRRSKALKVLANPAQALQLLQDFAAGLIAMPDTVPSPEDTDDTLGPDDEPEDPETVGEGDLHPSENDADDPEPETHSCPTCRGEGTVSGDPTAFTKPVRVDPKKLLPPVTLYIHLSEQSFRDPAKGVARFEGVGPITVSNVQKFLGDGCAVTVKQVIDPAGLKPVDAYETPDRLREALYLRSPACVFPWSVNLSRRKDAEHTVPYVDPDHGGPPGQTSIDNLALMGRFPHRLKTHGRWRLKQPEPGVFLWRSPHGWIFLVNNVGTHNLGNNSTARAFWDSAAFTKTEGGPGRPGRESAGACPVMELIEADVVIEYEPVGHTA